MMNNLDLILDQAFQAYNTKDFLQAETLCRQVLSAQPNHGDALFLMGLIAYVSASFEPAIEFLFQAVKAYPQIENYRLTLASVLQKQGRLNEALNHYQKCPNHPMGLTQQGFIYLQKNQGDFAKSAFDKALTLNPELPEARLGLALYQGDLTAIKQIAEQTNLPDAWYYLAKKYLQDNSPELALTVIDKTGLGEGTYLVEKGVILERLNRLDEALKIYQQAATLLPYCADIWANQANIFRHQGNLAAAEDYYKRALAQDKDHIAARHNLADLMVSQGRIAEALEQYRTVLSHSPNYIPSLYNLAVILERNNELAEAAGLYVKILLSPQAPHDTPWRLANTLAILSETNPKLATDFASGWLKNFPTDVVAQHTYAALTHQQEKDIIFYVQKLYDDFAETYDQTMRSLKSTAVSELVALLPHRPFAKALDLGCGTGAVGRLLKGHPQHLTGVDISASMLQKARETGAYHALFQEDIFKFLKQKTPKYDLITLVEVMGYIPDLLPLFQAITTRLKKNGLFAFSVETTAKAHPELAPNGRYLYPENYILQKLKEFNLSILKQKEIDIRLEGKTTAKGLILITQKQP